MLGHAACAHLWNSKTECLRHCSFFHGKKAPVLDLISKSTSTAKKQFTCNYKTNGKKCGLKFATYHQLNKHKTVMLHNRNPNIRQ